MKKLIPFIFVIVLILTAASIVTYKNKFGAVSLNPGKSTQTITNSANPGRIETLAAGLEVPWEIAFLPNNNILFTERSGNLKLLSNKKVLTVEELSDVKVYGEGGLLGLAVDPDFKKTHFIYIYYTFSGNNNQTLNRVVRYKFENNKLSDKKVLVDNIPGAIYHNGGRLKFGPDNFLYITTGDSLKPSLSQDKNSLAGKILRITNDGDPAPGNPFNNMVYSYGHRNPQGLAWDSNGRLWETEHGNNATDEVNIIIKGNNYGWPIITGSQTKTGMQSPFAQSGSDTWAPSSAEIIDDIFYFGGLRGASLFSIDVKGNTAIIKRSLQDEFGRIRAVTKGPNNLLFVSTSNRDGRGNPNAQDDRILQIDPSQL